MVQETKKSLSRLKEGDWSTRISRFLITQHVLPSTTTGKSPAELMMGRKLRTALDLLHPSSANRTIERQEKMFMEQRKETVTFQKDAMVWVRNLLSPHPKWLAGKVIKSCGPLSYEVLLGDGRRFRRHVDHLRPRWEDTTLSSASECDASLREERGRDREDVLETTTHAEFGTTMPHTSESSEELLDAESSETPICEPETLPRPTADAEVPTGRPTRVCRAPRYLQDYQVD